ncbi:hypothetical protein FQR65_LT20735 [Abscondita terminalis]|nr:hypothetical protein FQR65_LT20735 [Abscondita terminalis]
MNPRRRWKRSDRKFPLSCPNPKNPQSAVTLSRGDHTHPIDPYDAKTLTTRSHHPQARQRQPGNQPSTRHAASYPREDPWWPIACPEKFERRVFAAAARKKNSVSAGFEMDDEANVAGHSWFRPYGDLQRPLGFTYEKRRNNIETEYAQGTVRQRGALCAWSKEEVKFRLDEKGRPIECLQIQKDSNTRSSRNLCCAGQ